MSAVQLYLGDCLDILRGIPDGSADAVVTDPPAGIAFMGKHWDRDKGGRREWIGWLSSVLAECLRVAKPGSILLCWAIPRTSHWTGTAIEDAGWLIEDRIVHHFGSGFPKHKSKLKPATEDWWLARKPGGKKWLGVDACRVEANWDSDPSKRGFGYGWQAGDDFDGPTRYGPKHSTWEPKQGRYPPNLLLTHSPLCKRRGTKRVKGGGGANGHGGARSHGVDYGRLDRRVDSTHRDPDGTEAVADYDCHESCPIRLMNDQSGPGHAQARYANGWQRSDTDGLTYGVRKGGRSRDYHEPGAAGAARFFPNFDADPFLYAPKASRRERGEGNTHCTVKPIALMRWLCRLATPPGGTILDPFAGSGSTGVAAVAEGFGFVGIEREAEYHAIAERRIRAARAEVPLFA